MSKKTYAGLINQAGSMLADIGIVDADTDLFYLLQAVTGFSKAKYLFKRTETVPAGTEERFWQLVRRRAGHEPCQYILGKTEFMGLEFEVTPDVLIPRQDTEILAELAIRKLQEDGRPVRVLDLCTGSGALAVAVKAFYPEAEVTACDISLPALTVAEKNAKKNQVQIRFLQSDLFCALHEESFDLIVSNPPYVTEAEYRKLAKEVREYEPETALRAGKDGLDFYRKIAKQAGGYLKKGGGLFLEIGCSQAEAVKNLLAANMFGKLAVHQDLSGLDRVVTAEI